MVGYYRLKDISARIEAGAHIIPAADFEPVDQVTEIIEAAEARAREIIEDAERVFDEEKQRGYREGRQDAALEAVSRLVKERASLDEALRAAERDLCSLVESCVRKLIQTFDDSTRAEAVTRQALGAMRRERRVELRAPSNLFAFFRAHIDRIRADFPEIELIDVVEDESLEPEQVIVESSIGRVDANLGQRLKELTEILLPNQKKAELSPDLAASGEDEDLSDPIDLEGDAWSEDETEDGNEEDSEDEEDQEDQEDDEEDQEEDADGDGADE